MTRLTSIEAYQEIKANGLLSRRRFQVYETLHLAPLPLTAMETARRILGVLDHSISPRFAELKQQGVIEECGERPCRITGRTAILWRTTSELPVALKKWERIRCELCSGRGYTEQGRLL